MTTLKSDKDRELEEWKRQQSQKFLHGLSDNRKKDAFEQHLIAWGIVFMLIGVAALGLCVPLRSVLLGVVGLATMAVGILDFNRRTPGMLMVTGCLGVVLGLVLSFYASIPLRTDTEGDMGFAKFAILPWGPLMTVCAIVLLRDVAKARKAAPVAESQPPHDG